MKLNSNTSEEENAYIGGRELLLYTVEVSAKMLKLGQMKDSEMPNISVFSNLSKLLLYFFIFFLMKKKIHSNEKKVGGALRPLTHSPS